MAKNIKLILPMRTFEKIEIEFDSVEELKREYPQLVLDMKLANKEAQNLVNKYKEDREDEPPFEDTKKNNNYKPK